MEQQAYREQFELEDEHWWFEGRRAVMWALLARAGIQAPLHVLDAGCGTGRNLLEFSALGDVQGVDFSAEAIEFCAARGIEGVTRARIESLPFDDAAFDLVVATDVIEHLTDDRAALNELRRVAAPGGRLLVTVPAYPWLWGPHDDFYHHVRRYTLSSLRAALRDCGWSPLECSYFNSFLLAPIAAVRLAARARSGSRSRSGLGLGLGSGSGSRGTEPRLDVKLTPPALNGALLAPMKAEAALIRRGVRFPAGVSIGAVCERSA